MKNLTIPGARAGVRILLAMGVVFAPGCATQMQAMNVTHPVTINFDANGCAYSVNHGDLLVAKNDKVRWVSSPAAEFRIWFDPFRSGRPLSSRNGEVTSSPIDPDAPGGMTAGEDPTTEVHYKYTIVTMEGNEPRPGCKPLDPHIRVS